MHILEIPSFFPPYGGLFCLDQAKALASLGHEVRVLSNVQLGVSIGLGDYLTLPYMRYERQLEGVTVMQSYQRGVPKAVRFNVRRWLSVVLSMYEEYERKYGRPDVLHAHCAKWAGRAALLIGRRYGLPYVVTEHLPLMLLQEEYGPAPSTAWQIPLLREVYREASMVIPVSEELVADTACYYGRDYRWQYLSNTIDTDFYHYQPRTPSAGRSFRFCCLADYYPRKGYDVLFDAWRQLQQEGADVELHMAGRLTDASPCHSAIARHGLHGVTTYGRLDKHGVRKLLYHADALVLASRSEVQPLVLLEAMSTGIPVVSTECIPRCLRLEGGTTIVPIGDARALMEGMLHIVLTPVDGLALSRQVESMASPRVVGRKLEAVLKSAVSAY